MGVKKTIFAFCTAAAFLSCGGRYSDIQIDNEDVQGYVNAYTLLDYNHKDFLIYAGSTLKPDTLQIENYREVLHILNVQGFPDADYFCAVHSKLRPFLEVVWDNPGTERYPGIGTADLSFIEEGEKQYRQFLEDSTLSAGDKEFFRQQMAQIETTKVDLFDKQEKNRAWVSLVRDKTKGKTDAVLDDIAIMQLTSLASEVSRL